MRHLNRSLPRLSLRRLGAPALMAWLSTACGLQAEAPSEDQVGSTHAVISIERTEIANGEKPRAEALAGFLNVPPLVDAESVMKLVGLGLDLPDVGACLVGHTETTGGPLAETALVEFLEAGDVILDVAGAQERLAPYAFPTVTDSISGVLYTTRDRAAGQLASGSHYTITADGLGIRVAHSAPHGLDGVTASGIPLAEVSRVDTDSPVDLTWNVDTAGDTVYVELLSANGSHRTICSFADELGAGSVPTEGFRAGEAGQLVVHRLRSHAFEALNGEPARGQLRFDFALSATVMFE